MVSNNFALPERPKLSVKDFSRISSYVQEHYGIKLPIEKLILVESRLVKRITQLKLSSFADYVSFLFSRDGKEEQSVIIDFISTNKTNFFRENVHFKFLENHLRANKIVKPINIWSSACSSGEEPYTISMVLEEMKNNSSFGGTSSILATDISNTILNKAIRGEYPERGLDGVTPDLLKKYFILNNGVASIHSNVRKSISFRRFNLIDPQQYAQLTTKFDFIFCRNVLIYFDQPTQLKVIDNLIKKLVPGGILFLGHSETLLHREFPVIQLQPTIYQKTHE